METIAATTNAAKLQPHAIHLKKGMGITVGIKHADLVIPGCQIPFRTAIEIALRRLAPAKKNWLSLLGLRCRLLKNNSRNHRLDQSIRTEKDFFS